MRALLQALVVAAALTLSGVASADEPQAASSATQPPVSAGSQKARVTFVPPADVKGLLVTFDGATVPVRSLGTRAFTIEPGLHAIRATGLRAGNEVAYETSIQIEPGQFVEIPLPMTEVSAASSPQGSGCLAPGRTEEEVNQCISAKAPPQAGCGTCLVSPAQPAPRSAWLLCALPLVALARRRARRRPRALLRTSVVGAAGLGIVLCAACGSSSSGNADVGAVFPDASASDEAGPVSDGASPADASSDAASTSDASSVPCTIRISYGAAWLRPMNHASAFDDVSGTVSWDGVCTNDAANSYARLSNGFQPYFQGHDACIIALDQRGACPKPPPACTTRISYGAAWLPPANHPAMYDDVPGRVFTDGICHDSGAQSYAVLNNGFQPTFAGKASCALSFLHTQCGGLYTNPVIDMDCPDPGVLLDGDTYYLSCTSGNAANAFPIYTSSDLGSWKPAGHVLPQSARPAWAKSDFWAPEIHRVGNGYVAYFSARGADGMLAIGAAHATSPLGPYTALAAPLIHDANMGLIDVSEVEAAGARYVLWKEDGNAVGKPTPIHAQPLAADGLSLSGAPSTLITNDQPWEGAVVEGPFMVSHGGMYYLFYSGNSYANGTYAVGVAHSSSPLGPFIKAPAPMLTTGGAWAGPGHCSVLDTPAGDTAIVYHAWKSTAVGGPPGRLVLVDQIEWNAGAPAIPMGPSSTTRPLP